jgi:hypothetical protein
MGESFVWWIGELFVPLYYMNGPTTIYLKTPTSTLTRSAIRQIAMETMDYCMQTMGTNPSIRVPRVSVIKRGRSKNYGSFDIDKNNIIVYHNVCETVGMTIRTIIHEYTHYLQDMKQYQILYKKVGYNKHPYELEARRNEKLYSPCWKTIKNKI